MKKFIFALCASLMALPVMAYSKYESWMLLKPQVVKENIDTFIDEHYRALVWQTYDELVDSKTGRISIKNMYKVCDAGGMKVNTDAGYSQCKYFISQLENRSRFGTAGDGKADCEDFQNGVWVIDPFGNSYQCVGRDTNTLVYSKSCDSSYGTCIKDFSDLHTQGPNGREFIKAYAEKNNLNLTCQNNIDTRYDIDRLFGRHYIQCSAKGKAYEFEFFSLNTDPGETSVKSENKTICNFYGGKWLGNEGKEWHICDTYGGEKSTSSQQVCKKMTNLAGRLGRNGFYHGYCRLSKTVPYEGIWYYRLDGVDSKKYYKAGKMRADKAKVQVEEYLRGEFPEKSSTVYCEPTVKEFRYGLGLDQDYVMTCYVGFKRVDFLFDDLTANSDRARAGQDAMECINNGGKFKGETCRGPNKSQCDEIDATLRAKGSMEGAQWDKDLRACIMGNAMKTYKRDVVKGYIIGAIVIVGGTLVVIGTDGLSAPVVIEGAAVLLSDIGINYGIDWNHRRLSRKAASRFESFMSAAEACTDEPCALKVLEDYHATLSNVIDDLSTDDQEIINEMTDYLLSLITTEYVPCGENSDGVVVYAPPAECAKQKSSLWVRDYIDPYTEPVLVIFSVVYPQGWLTSRFMRLRSVSKAMKTFNVSRKEAERMLKAGEVVEDAKGVMTRTKNIENLGDVNKSTNIVASLKVRKLERVRETPATSVFKFTDRKTGKIYYLKHTDEMEEITRTKRAYEILNGKSDIVHTVKVVEDDQKILTDFAKKHNITNSKGEYWFLMEGTPSSFTAGGMINFVDDPLNTIFNGKPITLAEQKEILKAVDELNAGGILHGDLHSNMFFMREKNGKLRVDIIDFEPWSAQEAVSMGQDKKNVNAMFDMLAEKGLAERASGTATRKTQQLARYDDMTKLENRTNNVLNQDIDKLYSEFKIHNWEMVNIGQREVRIPKDRLSAAEWENLKKAMQQRGEWYKTTSVDNNYYVIRLDLDKLKSRASSNFDNYVQQCLNGGNCVGLPYERLTDEEWYTLRRAVQYDEGVWLTDVRMADKNGEKGRYMRFEPNPEGKVIVPNNLGTFDTYKPLIDDIINGNREYVEFTSYIDGFGPTMSKADQEALLKYAQDKGLSISTVNGTHRISKRAISSPTTKGPSGGGTPAPVKKGPLVQKPIKTDDGIKVGRWNFKSTTDSKSGVKYYECVFGNEYMTDEQGANVVNTIIKEFDVQHIFVFRQNDDKFVMVIFDSSDDANKFLKQHPNPIHSVIDDAPNIGERNVNVFSEAYNEIPEAELKQKIDYVNAHTGKRAEEIKALEAAGDHDKAMSLRLSEAEDMVNALKHVGAFNEKAAMKMSKDIATEVVYRIIENGSGDYVTAMKRWPELSIQQRENLARNLHEVVTTVRRKHDGNTDLKIFNDPLSSLKGSHTAPKSGCWERMFNYNIGRPTIDALLETIVHENTHALQSIGKSSLHPSFVKYADDHYVPAKVYYDLYENNLLEVEANFVGKQGSKTILDALDRLPF